MVIKSKFDITCYYYNGVEKIKNALLIGESYSTKEIVLKFILNGSPHYTC